MQDDPRQGDGTLRDRLALTRTQLANERTALAYARTAIMLAVTGATLLKLYGDTLQNVLAGWALVMAAISVALLGAQRFRQLARRLS